MTEEQFQQALRVRRPLLEDVSRASKKLQAVDPNPTGNPDAQFSPEEKRLRDEAIEELRAAETVLAEFDRKHGIPVDHD